MATKTIKKVAEWEKLRNIWVKVFCLGKPYHFKFFKGCLPQILLGPFLNILTHKFHNFSHSADFLIVLGVI